MNDEQIAKIMDNTIHGLLIKNVKSFCEKLTSDPQFSKLYTHDKENYILNKLRYDFTDYYKTLMFKIEEDFSNCELNDFKFLCYLGLKITSQLMRIDNAIKKFDYRRRLSIWEKSKLINSRIIDLLETIGCPLSEQEKINLMNFSIYIPKKDSIVVDRVLRSKRYLGEIEPPVLYDGSPYGKM